MFCVWEARPWPGREQRAAPGAGEIDLLFRKLSQKTKSYLDSQKVISKREKVISKVGASEVQNVISNR